MKGAICPASSIDAYFSQKVPNALRKEGESSVFAAL
jgi:hypothetical protein